MAPPLRPEAMSTTDSRVATALRAPGVEADTALLERLAILTSVAGGVAESFRAFRAHFAALLPDLGFALLRIDEHVALIGFIGADGTEVMATRDGAPARGTWSRSADALARRVAAVRTDETIELMPQERSAPLACALGSPASMHVIGADTRGVSGLRIAFTSDVQRRFDRIDLAALAAEARVAFAILAAGLRERLVVHQHAEIEGLADIQRLLQPDNPVIRGIEYAVHWQPAATAAGDYYDLMTLTPYIEGFVDAGADAWGVSIADVSGHGAAAAMEAVQFDAILRTYEGNEPPGGPAGAATYANRYFFSRRQRRHFMTLLLVGGRPDVGRIAYVCAGHPPGIVRRADGRIDRIGAGTDAGIPLGILREHRWENHEADFRRGDTLVVCTDGILEARDATGELFGAARFERVIAESDGSPASIVASVRDEVIAFQRSPLGADDQTLIAVRSVA